MESQRSRLSRLALSRWSRIALVAGGFAVAIVSCGREPTSPLTTGTSVVRYARGLSFEPVFPEILSQVSGGPGALVAFHRVRIVLRHSDGTLALDTVVNFPAGSDSIMVSLTVRLLPGAPASGEPLSMNLAYVNAAGDTVFTGGPVTVNAVPSGEPVPPPVQIPVRYSGPGAGATRVLVAPRSVSVFENDPFTFTAVASDAGGNTLAGTPIFWTSLDPTFATVTTPGSGAGTAQSVRGTARIVAQLLTGPKDTVTVQVVLRARHLAAQTGSGQSGTAGQALTQPVVAKVTASDGIAVSGVAVAFAVASGGGAVGAASVTTDAAGLAQTTWTLGPTVGTQTVTATATGLTGSPATFSATAIAAVPTQLVVTTQPVSTTAGATMTAVVVTAKDAANNTTTTFTGPVTVAFGANPSLATLSGTTTVNAVAGVATFSTLSVDRPGAGYTLVASTPNVMSATTAAFDVTAGPGRRLEFGAYPVNGATAGTTIDAITVIARDTAGNLATSFNGTVTLGLGASPAGAVIGGSATATAVNGVATFDAVRLTKAGSYRFTANATGLSSVSGPEFVLRPGVAAALGLVSGGGQSAAGGTVLSAPLVVQVLDGYGNSVFGAGRTVNFAIGSGGGSVGTPSATSDAAGQASTTWTLGFPAGAQSLVASSAGLTSLTIGATATSGGLQVNYTWTGAVDTMWTTAGNWSPSGVPTATDSVYLPAGAGFTPAITTAVAVKHLVLATCAYFNNHGTLTVTGHLIDDWFSCSLASSRADAPGGAAAALRRGASNSMNSVSGTGTIVLSGTGNVVGYFMGGLSITGGTRTIVGSTHVAGTVSVSGASTLLDLNGNVLDVDGDFGTASGGKFKMMDPEDLDELYVDGNVSFAGGSTTGLLTHGYMRVYGNFTQSGGAADAFAPDAGHNTELGYCAVSCALLRTDARSGARDRSLRPQPSGRVTKQRAAREKERADARLTRPNGEPNATGRARKDSGIRERRAARLGGVARRAPLNTQFEPMSYFSGTSVVTFANSGTGAGTSHFGGLYVSADQLDLASNVMVEGQVEINSTLVTGTNRVLTSRGADVYGPTFEGVRWVLLDGSDVYSLDYVTFVNMDPTVDQFTVERDGVAGSMCDCNDVPTLWYWDFEMVPTSGHYVRAVDTDGPTPSALNINVYHPAPSSHGGFLQLLNGATSNWPVSFDWLGVTSDWHLWSNWSTGYVPGVFDDVVIRSAAAFDPQLTQNGSVHHLTIEAGRRIEHFCSDLVVYGNVVAPLGAEATGDGECHDFLKLMGDGSAGGNSVVGWFLDVYVGGNYKVSGAGSQLIVSRELEVGGTGNLTVNGARVDVGGVGGTGYGLFSTTSDGTLTMTNSADELFVGSGATFQGGSTAGLLTAGKIRLVDALLQTVAGGIAAFAPSASHTTEFGGTSSAVKFGDASSWLQNALIRVSSVMELRSDVVVKGTLANETGTGPEPPTVYANTAVSLPATPLLTVSGLNVSAANPTIVWNVMLKFVDGSSSATFDAIGWRGFPGGFTGTMFDFARTATQTYSFASHSFSSAFLTGGLGTGGLYVKNSGTQPVTFTSVLGVTPSPFTLTSGQSNP